MTLQSRVSVAEDLESPVPLRERERRFVERFMTSGNATKAAEQAGYSRRAASQIGYRLLRKAQIQRAIAERTRNDPAVWTREDRQRFWTQVASGTDGFRRASLRDRLRASELLGRSQADFIDRQQDHEGPSFYDLLMRIDAEAQQQHEAD